MKRSTSLLLFLMALVFSIGLTFASVELPRLLNSWVYERVYDPGFDHNYNEETRFQADLYIRHFHLRTIGYASLGITLLLVIAGFVSKRTKLASAGALLLFLPVFGHFAISMFFLAGLGLLRSLWLPFTDISFDLLALGDIVYLPLDIILAGFKQFHLYPYRPLAYLVMGIGILLFTLGVLAWFQSRYARKGVAIHQVYKYSRHPQYLGWIIWSYGFLIFLINNTSLGNFKITYSVPSSLPWALMTLIIILVCLFEELQMEKKQGESYRVYRSKAPFLLPLPRFLRAFFSWPWRVFEKNGRRNRRSILLGGLLALVLLISSSMLYSYIKDRWRIQKQENRIELSEDTLLRRFTESGDRREKYQYRQAIQEKQPFAIAQFTGLLDSPDANTREFCLGILGYWKIQEAEEVMILCLTDSIQNVRGAAVRALLAINSSAGAREMIRRLPYENSRIQWNMVDALAEMNMQEAIPSLKVLIQTEDEFLRYRCAMALEKLGSSLPYEYITPLLKAENHFVQRQVRYWLMQHDTTPVINAFTDMLGDPNRGNRLFAEEILREMGHGDVVDALIR